MEPGHLSPGGRRAPTTFGITTIVRYATVGRTAMFEAITFILFAMVYDGRE
jgi:hypothetical protein